MNALAPDRLPGASGTPIPRVNAKVAALHCVLAARTGLVIGVDLTISASDHTPTAAELVRRGERRDRP
jgi:hypothetical protein